MRIVFMGTPEFAATILEDLVQQHDVVAVYSRPDAVRGRGALPQPSPVKLVADRYGLSVYTPKTLRDTSVQQQLAALNPDVICVAAYGCILPQEVLDVPHYGCLNVHGSLLPQWRGAAPIERAILAGDKVAGVCIMRMEEGLDTGDFSICRTAAIEDKTAEELADELANLGSHALLTALVHLQEGVAEWMMQDADCATYAEKIGKHELDIAPTDNARQAVLKVQASSSAHTSRCMVAGRPVTMLRLAGISDDPHVHELLAEMMPGNICFIEKRLYIGVCDGAVEVLTLKPDGKQAMDAKSFAAGIQNIKNNSQIWSASDVR